MSVPHIFDRKTYALHRLRAARRGAGSFLVEDVAEHLAMRIGTVNRRFQNALDLSSRDESFLHLKPSAENWTRSFAWSADEEALPFAPGSFDLVVSVLALHAVNDLPGALVQIRQCLKPDGLFIAALFGGETLSELRQAFAAGELDASGGISPRVAPFADVRDLGGLLQRAGFALPVADVERTFVRYRKFDGLVADLRALGETNALHERLKKPLSRNVLAATLARYASEHAEADGRLRATFEVIYLTGWSPHESQQKPLRPGAAKMRLADALGTHELPAGEKADPTRR